MRKLRMSQTERLAEQKRLMDLAGKRWHVRTKDIRKALRKDLKERRRSLYSSSAVGRDLRSRRGTRIYNSRTEFLKKAGELDLPKK